MPGAAPGGGSGGAGGLISSGKVGGSGRGAGLGLTPLGVKRRLLSGSCSLSSEITGAGPQEDPVAARGGSSGLPSPSPVSPRAERSRCSGRFAPPRARHPRVCVGTRAAGQGDTFLCTQATVPSAPGCCGQGSPQQAAAGSTEPLPCSARGARPRVGLGCSRGTRSQPGARPPCCQPPSPCQWGSQTGRLVPAAALGWQRRPAGATTRGCDPGQSWVLWDRGSSGRARAPQGTGSSSLRGVTSGGGSRAAPASGSGKRVVLGLFISGGGCRGAASQKISAPNPVLGPGGHCHVL